MKLRDINGYEIDIAQIWFVAYVDDEPEMCNVRVFKEREHYTLPHAPNYVEALILERLDKSFVRCALLRTEGVEEVPRAG